MKTIFIMIISTDQKLRAEMAIPGPRIKRMTSSDIVLNANKSGNSHHSTKVLNIMKTFLALEKKERSARNAKTEIVK